MIQKIKPCDLDLWPAGPKSITNNTHTHTHTHTVMDISCIGARDRAWRGYCVIVDCACSRQTCVVHYITLQYSTVYSWLSWAETIKRAGVARCVHDNIPVRRQQRRDNDEQQQQLAAQMKHGTVRWGEVEATTVCLVHQYHATHRTHATTCRHTQMSISLAKRQLVRTSAFSVSIISIQCSTTVARKHCITTSYVKTC